MARICYVRSGLCAYFFIVLRINWAYSSSDYHFYQTGSPYHRSEHHLLLELQENDIQNSHTIHRREVSLENIKTSKPNTSITDELIIPINATTAKIQKQLNNTIIKLTLTKEMKNLGLNGTGQRKYYPPVNTTLSGSGNVTIVAKKQQPMNQTTVEDDDDDDVIKFPDTAKLNDTLKQKNMTTKRDTHIYYNSTIKTDKTTGQYYWVDMENRTDVKINELLSASHRRAATIKLSFDFPFYGHLIKNVTIATGGFLYTGDYVHSWLAATQYIAPLMANFDTSLSNDSYIKYLDNGTAFTVEWEKVSLQDKPKEGAFTFQVTLHANGDVVFVYQTVPLFIENIRDDQHPVKVGLSDAYIMDRTVFFVRRKTIYEYHRLNFPKEDIKNWTVIYLRALPTCLDNKDCETCLTKKIPQFKCSWCPTTKRCSNGVDRNRQDWIAKHCEQYHLNDTTLCSQTPPGAPDEDEEVGAAVPPYETVSRPDEDDPSSLPRGNAAQPQPADKMGMSAIVAILFLICMAAGLSLWILYAYRNPHTTSGQMLIRYRPSQWHWRRGEARYTAATIHM